MMYQGITIDFKKLAEDAIDEVLKEKRLNSIDKNRGTHGDSSFMLDGLPSSRENSMPLGMGNVKNWSVEILRYPTEEDWKRCLMLARCTQGKFDTPNEPSDDWKKKILRSEHSPIRTLMFTIKMENIPYCNSVHFVRHKYGVEHYVQSQRKNPERGAERQDAPVTHIMDINAAELLFMARKRLCFKADIATHEIMAKIVYEICKKDDIYRGLFAPACNCNEKNCREFKPCGMFNTLNRQLKHQAISEAENKLDDETLHRLMEYKKEINS